MFGNYFYNKILQKVTVAFGNLFNKIEISHCDNNGIVIEKIKVPITYGPRDKLLMRVIDNPDLYRDDSIRLPQMSFEITGIDYDSTRKLNTIKFNKSNLNSKKVDYQYNGVPYNIKFKLSILSKLIDDANQIVEQILPYFTPGFTVTINTIPELGIKDDLNVILDSISMSDNYSDDFMSRRNVEWELEFNVNCFFYGAVKSKSSITTTITDFHTYVARDIREKTEVTVDEFGYLNNINTTITEYNDGKVRDNDLRIDVPVVHKIEKVNIPSRTIVSKVTLK